MNVWKTIPATVVGLAIGVLGYALGGFAQGENPPPIPPLTPIEQRIVEAKTSADHEAIAAYYEKEAKDAHQKHLQHQRMSESYAKIPPLPQKTSAVSHCNTIAKNYDKVAKDYEDLATLHKAMAAPVK